MKQGYRRKPNRFTEIAEERITELFRQAQLRFNKSPELSDRYVQLARKISMKYKVKLPKELKRRFCKHCLKYLVPGNNCRIRLTEHKVVYTCLGCNECMRFPCSKKTKDKGTVKKASAIEEIIKIARQCNTSKSKWHFHLLLPGCVFNKDKKNAFVLETAEGSFVFLSEKWQKEAGKELLELSRGKAILNDAKEAYRPSEKIGKILTRAESLNIEKVKWHHHLLYPDCIYNKHKGKWCIAFEDPLTKELIESVTDSEPHGDIKAVEMLYYKQEG